ncbi:hypothetical protein [Zunongwangia sp. H14]|uniref:hypothetical protein n=1 Tax=Zunongwangia sp. H14 TaxID=3240792 RepID=UPI003561AC97
MKKIIQLNIIAVLLADFILRCSRYLPHGIKTEAWVNINEDPFHRSAVIPRASALGHQFKAPQQEGLFQKLVIFMNKERTSATTYIPSYVLNAVDGKD